MSSMSVHVVGEAGVGKRSYLSSFGGNTRDSFKPFTRLPAVEPAVTFSVSSTLKELKAHKEHVDVYHLLYSKKGLKTVHLWVEAIREKDPEVPIYLIFAEYKFCEEHLEFVNKNRKYINSLGADKILCLFFENNYGLTDVVYRTIDRLTE